MRFAMWYLLVLRFISAAIEFLYMRRPDTEEHPCLSIFLKINAQNTEIVCFSTNARDVGPSA